MQKNLLNLHLSSLEYHRIYFDMVMFMLYKHTVDLPFEKFLSFPDVSHNTRGHPRKSQTHCNNVA